MSSKIPPSLLEQIHTDALATIRASFPGNGYHIVAVTFSSKSESMYVYVVYKRRLYYLRFAIHNNQAKGRNYKSFNLLEYDNWGQLQTELHQPFLIFGDQRMNAYHIMGYYNFLWLALAYRSSTNPAFQMLFDPSEEKRQVDFVMNGEQFATVSEPRAFRRLQAAINLGLVTPTDKSIKEFYQRERAQISITSSGQKLLNYYPKMAVYGTDHVWQKDPRTYTIQQAVKIFNHDIWSE